MLRKSLIPILARRPMALSELARLLDLKRGEAEAELRHVLRSALQSGWRPTVEPACCRSCGFQFADDQLGKPSKCPECRSTWISEARVGLAAGPAHEGKPVPDVENGGRRA